MVPAQSSIPNRDQFYAGLQGEWTGQLEYRDFSSNERVILPTWLDVKSSVDRQSLQLIYTYDDGPTKTVRESSTITLEPATRRFTITSDRDHSAETYQIADLGASKGSQRLHLVLSGTGAENDKPVDVRITITIDRNLYRFTKETRMKGQEFAFRDGYTLTRRNSAKKAN